MLLDRAAFVLLGFTALVSACLAQPAGSVSGRWEGTVSIPGRAVTLVIDLGQDNSGNWIGSATLPGLNVKGAPLTKLDVKDRSLSFTISGALGEPAMKGQIGSDAISGDFTAGGNMAPLLLHRTGAAQVDLPLKSTAVQPELEGEWNAEIVYLGNPLRVKLTLANENGMASGKFSLIRTKETPFPVTLVRQEDAMLTVQLANGLSLETMFDPKTGEIRGTILLGSVEAPIVLRKRGAR
jgi:hypothetical protein